MTLTLGTRLGPFEGSVRWRGGMGGVFARRTRRAGNRLSLVRPTSWPDRRAAPWRPTYRALAVEVMIDVNRSGFVESRSRYG